MPFWTRRRYCFLLCRSSVLGGVWLFRMRCRGAAFSASPGSAAPCFLSMYWGSFLLLRGFQRCRFGPAAGPFFLLCLSSDLSGVALFRMHCRGAAFSASPGSAAPCVLSMYWGAFLLLRGFQRCRFGPAAGPFFLLCLSSDLSGFALFRMHCRGAAFSASPGSAAPCVLSMYWGAFLLRGFLQDLCYVCLGDLVTSSRQPAARATVLRGYVAPIFFFSVVLGWDAGRGLVDDPTSLGTCFSIWRLARALYPATFLTRLNLLATFRACVGESAHDDTASDSKRANNFYVPLPCPIPHSLGVGGMGGSP